MLHVCACCQVLLCTQGGLHSCMVVLQDSEFAFRLQICSKKFTSLVAPCSSSPGGCARAQPWSGWPRSRSSTPSCRSWAAHILQQHGQMASAKQYINDFCEPCTQMLSRLFMAHMPSCSGSISRLAKAAQPAEISHSNSSIVMLLKLLAF